ncbi:hypothetical protein OCU04_009778 [Sclerotinia nivalis]|uniref:Uncharacterized protein n=1 Tax=Sclerotinia nivalis TaxID=352851 RepID=A0A9X0DGV2_9HELO|nr:hypothetical protein OCU04_009778 [Sclerotinia nivalis]
MNEVFPAVSVDQPISVTEIIAGFDGKVMMRGSAGPDDLDETDRGGGESSNVGDELDDGRKQ